MVDILKDRLRGFEGSSTGLYYDRPSKRFFTDEYTLDHKYKWDKNVYNSALPYPPEQLIQQNEEEVYGNIDKRRS